MRRSIKVLAITLLLFVAACGEGNKGNSDPAPTADPVAVTPKLHLAILDANRMQIRTSDGSTKSDYMLITFTNMSAGKVIGSPYSLPQAQPVYPFNFNFVPGFNHVEIKYMNSTAPEDATDYLPQGATATCAMPAYLADNKTAVTPNLIPMSGLSGLVLEAPKSGDYAPWVYVGLENADGTVKYMLYQKPVLPLKIPLSGYVSATVSTGAQANDGSYSPGASKSWDFGPDVPNAVILPSTIMTPASQASQSVPVTPVVPATPVIPGSFVPTVITINTFTKQTNLGSVMVGQKIVNLSADSPEETVLDSAGNVLAGYAIDWEGPGTHYYNDLQLPVTSFAIAAMPLGSGVVKPSLVRPDKTRVYFDTSKCQVFVNGVDVTKTATATSGFITY